MRRSRSAREPEGFGFQRTQMIPEPQMPTYEDLLWPTLEALESIGGSASIQELSSQLAIDMSLPDEILDVLHMDGPQTKVF